MKEHNTNRSQISDHRYRMLIIRVSGSGKTNSLVNLVSHQPDSHNIHLFAKDLYEENNNC